MAGQKTARRSDGRLTRIVSQTLEGVIAAFLSFVVIFLLCAGLSVLTGLVIGIETGSPSRTVRFIQIGWQFQLLAQFVHVRISSVPIGLAPLLLTGIVLGIISAFSSRIREPGVTPAVSGAISWLFFTLLVQWSFQSAVDDPWYLLVPKVLGMYLLALVPRGIARLRPVVADRLHRSGPAGRRFAAACHDGLRLARLVGIVWLVVSVIVAVVWTVRGSSAYSAICSLLGMKSVSFAICVVLSLFWAPNMVLWAGVWVAGGTIRVGSVASYSLGSATGSGLPLIPMFGLLPTAVASSGARTSLRLLPWLVPAVAAVCFTLCRHGLGWHQAVGQALDLIHRQEAFAQANPEGSAAAVSGSGIWQVSGTSITDTKSTEDAPRDDRSPSTAGPSKTVETDGTSQAVEHDGPRKAGDPDAVSVLAVRMIPGLFCLIIAACALFVGTVVLVWFSDGSLGTKNLSFVGIRLSTALGHLFIPVIGGLAAGWLLTCCVCLLLVVIRHHGVTPELVRDRVHDTLSPLFTRQEKPAGVDAADDDGPDGAGHDAVVDGTFSGGSTSAGLGTTDPSAADAQAGASDDSHGPDRGDSRSDASAGYPMTMTQSAADYFRSSHDASSSSEKSEGEEK